MSILYFLFVILLQWFIVDGKNLVEPIPLNVGVHLFVDNQYLENISSLEFQNGLIEKDTDHPIVYPEYPWENAVHFFTSLVQVPPNLSVTGKPMYLIYYSCTDKNMIITQNDVPICIANSTDGVKWEKPLLWYYPYTANGTQPPQPSNIVFVTGVGKLLGSAFLILVLELLVLKYLKWHMAMKPHYMFMWAHLLMVLIGLQVHVELIHSIF